MTEFGIIADDLTSATDGAAALARTGWHTEIQLGRGASSSLDAPVVSVDIDSRVREPAEAAARASAAATALAGARILYKTVDSTLRGHLAVELRAVLAVSGRKVAIVAPAFPAGGRTTTGGVQRLRGLAVHQTEFARDPLHPVRESRIKTLLENAGLGSIVELSQTEAGNPAALAGALEHARCLVADAETQADLVALLRAAPDPSRIIWVGSPGMAEALAAVFPGRGRDQAPPPPSTRVLTVVGSLNPVSRRQLARLRAAPGIASVEIQSGALKADSNVEVDRCRAEMSAHFSADAQLVVLAADSSPGDPASIAAALGRAAAALVASNAVDGLVLTGGDIAARVLGFASVTRVVLSGEVEPGVPLGNIQGLARPCGLVTKAGGFGDEETLLRANHALLEPAPWRGTP